MEVLSRMPNLLELVPVFSGRIFTTLVLSLGIVCWSDIEVSNYCRMHETTQADNFYA
jgi:hypothetical protein